RTTGGSPDNFVVEIRAIAAGRTNPRADDGQILYQVRAVSQLRISLQHRDSRGIEADDAVARVITFAPIRNFVEVRYALRHPHEPMDTIAVLDCPRQFLLHELP